MFTVLGIGIHVTPSSCSRISVRVDSLRPPRSGGLYVTVAVAAAPKLVKEVPPDEKPRLNAFGSRMAFTGRVEKLPVAFGVKLSVKSPPQALGGIWM